VSDQNLPAAEEESEPWRLWDHIGVISGIVLGVLAFAILCLLAVAGDPGALAIILVVAVGVALIYLGGRLHGPRRS
jgi:hypothetical protein